MDTVPMGLFSMGGVDFGISFVTSEHTLNDLKSVAGQHGLSLIFIGETDDGESVGVLSTEDPAKVDINGFLKVIKKQNRWIPDHYRLDDGIRMLTFYGKETLS